MTGYEKELFEKFEQSLTQYLAAYPSGLSHVMIKISTLIIGTLAEAKKEQDALAGRAIEYLMDKGFWSRYYLPCLFPAAYYFFRNGCHDGASIAMSRCFEVFCKRMKEGYEKNQITQDWVVNGYGAEAWDWCKNKVLHGN